MCDHPLRPTVPPNLQPKMLLLWLEAIASSPVLDCHREAHLLLSNHLQVSEDCYPIPSQSSLLQLADPFSLRPAKVHGPSVGAARKRQ